MKCYLCDRPSLHTLKCGAYVCKTCSKLFKLALYVKPGSSLDPFDMGFSVPTKGATYL